MSGDHEFEGLDSAEREILEREIAEGHYRPLKAVSIEELEGEDDRKARLRREHHEAIVAGKIDIGPITKHEHITEDIRDMRDPTALADRLDDLTLAADRHYGDEATAVQVYVYADNRQLLDGVPRYDPGESMVTETAKSYRQELVDRAADGDRFAISMLTTGKPGDSDA